MVERSGPIAPSSPKEPQSPPKRDIWQHLQQGNNLARQVILTGFLGAGGIGVGSLLLFPKTTVNGVSSAAGAVWGSLFHSASYVQSRVESERWDHETAATAICNTKNLRSIHEKGTIGTSWFPWDNQNVEGTLSHTVLQQVCERPNQATETAYHYLLEMYREAEAADSDIEAMNNKSLVYAYAAGLKEGETINKGEFFDVESDLKELGIIEETSEEQSIIEPQSHTPNASDLMAYAESISSHTN